MMRNILAVAAGFAGWTVLFLGVNAAVQAAMPDAFREDGTTESTGLLVLFLVLTVVYSLIAGYLCARLAHDKPMQWVVVLGVLLLVVGIIAQLQFWDVVPLWYHLAFLALLLPMTVVGGRLQLSRSSSGT